MQTALTLVSCLLDKETFEHNFQEKELRGVNIAYMTLALLLLVLDLIVLPGTAQAESSSSARGWFIVVYPASVFIAVGGFLLQAIARGEMMKKSRNQKTRAKEDNNTPLDDSTKRSVATPESSQQQAIVTPKEESKKPQGEPSPTGSQNRGESGTAEQSSRSVSTPKEGTEDSRKPHA